MFAGLLELLFPPKCLGCGRHGVQLCEPCRHDLPLLASDACRRCALPRGLSGACRGCQGLSRALASIHAACAYDGAARQAVHALKFRGARSLAPLMGEVLRAHLARRPLTALLVVPVPLSSRRARERGYNQAELLAAEIVDTVGGRLVVDVLERRHRAAQQMLTAAARRENLEGAISARCSIAGATVLLVDDVATTGATLSACADALKAAGASKVSALVFARSL